VKSLLLIDKKLHAACNFGLASSRASRALVLCLILGTVFGTVGIVRYVPAAEPESLVLFQERPARALPREWRWEPKPVAFKHMYRNQSTQRLGWIRHGGRR